MSPHYPNPKSGCSGEAAALRAGEGDSGECLLCDRTVPMDEMRPVFEGLHHICNECHERIEERRKQRKAAVDEALKTIVEICRPANLNP